MNPNPNKLDLLISKLKVGPLENGSLLEMNENEKDLIMLASELKFVPTLTPPKASKRRKYQIISQPSPVKLLGLFALRLMPMGVAVIIFLFVGVSFAAWQSVPGQTLFSVKKSAEQMRVKFAGNDLQKAYLQVQIAKKRVTEAEKAVTNLNASDPRLALAAVKELTQATETASKEVKTLPISDIRTSEKPLLATLEDISTKEKNLVDSMPALEREDVIALSLKNQTRVSEIKQAVKIAVAEEAMANLSADPNTVSISGLISQTGKNALTVEKTQFILDENSTLISQDGNAILAEALKTGNKISITGNKKEGKLVALKITLLNSAGQSLNPEVKGETKQPDTAISSAQNPPTTTSPSLIKSPIMNSEEPIIEKTNPNQAVGGYIFEDPSPQYAP